MSGYKVTNTDGIILVTNGKGFSIPTVNGIANASSGVPEGTIIYDTETQQLYRFTGSVWVSGSGTAGTAGSSGSSGSSGVTGSSGTSGSTGTSGTGGSSGSTGSSGSSGSSGTDGTSGSSGSSGSSGNAGTNGSSGSSGSAGTSGSAGSSGTSGDPGTSGSTGTSGSSGSSGSSGQTVPGGFSIQYGATNLNSTSYISGQISYSSSSLITNGGDLRISGVDGNSNTIQDGMGATVLDQLISNVAGAGSSILRIFEMGDSSKVNYYTFSAFSKRTNPTNTDATFTSLNYIGGSGTTTFAKPCISLSISGGSGTAGTSGISTANARASNLYTSVANQTEFTIGYTVGQVDVYVNGVKLASSDFTATNGTSVILDTAPPAGSLVDITAFTTGGGIGYSGLTATTPIVYNQQTGDFSIPKAGNGTSGFLSSTDWISFSAKNATGAQGPAGTAGSSGSSGSAGSSGSSGSTGSSGSSGSTGTSGSSGSTGSSGSSGSTGSSGSSGSTGTSGSSGSSGSAGSSGSTGSSGSSGSSGSTGTSGSSGSTGSSGSSGSSGSTGSSGSSGSTGSSGSSGQTGTPGSSGTSGTSPSAAAYVAKAGDTMTGQLTVSYGGAILNLNNTTASSNANFTLGNNISSNGGGIALFGSTFASSSQYRASGHYIYSNQSGGLTLHAEGANSLYLATNGTAALTINSSQGITVSQGISASGTISAPIVQASSNVAATGLYLRSTMEVLSGEDWTTALYNYNSNDGFLVLNRDTSDVARPVFHVGGWNNPGYGGWSNGDSMITLVRSDGTKTTGTANAFRGLSNSSFYSNIVKTSTKTIFKDSQGMHEFDGSMTERRSGENVVYNEGSYATTSQWNNGDTYNMTVLGPFGNCVVHGWNPANKNFTLSLSSLPSHSYVKVECYIHLVDSVDDEWNYASTTNDAGTYVQHLQFKKVYNAPPNSVTFSNGAFGIWNRNIFYSYRPWANGSHGQDGFYEFSTNWQPHTASTFNFRFITDVDQPATDEAVYISHVKVTVR